MKEEYSSFVGFVRKRINDAADRDAEDIVQDVVVKMLDTNRIRPAIPNPIGYIYQALRNKIVDIFRKRPADLSLDAAIEEDGVTLMDLLHDMRYDTSTRLEKRDMKKALYRAIDSLGEEERTIIVMTEFEGISFREIADELEVPIGTLLSRKSRALKKIKTYMGNMDFTP